MTPDSITQAVAPLAPPTVPGRLSVPHRPAQWPGIVGSLCAILGGLGTLGSLAMIAYYIVIATGTLDKFFESIQAANPAMGPGMNSISGMKEYMVLLAAIEAVKLALTIMLLIAGLCLTAHRPVAVPLAKSWSVMKIIVTFLATGMGIWIQQRILQTTLSGSTLPPGSPASMPMFMWSGAIMGGLFAIAWGCALPAFLLFWLHRRPVKAEIARWRSPAL